MDGYKVVAVVDGGDDIFSFARVKNMSQTIDVKVRSPRVAINIEHGFQWLHSHGRGREIDNEMGTWGFIRVCTNRRLSLAF